MSECKVGAGEVGRGLPEAVGPAQMNSHVRRCFSRSLFTLLRNVLLLVMNQAELVWFAMAESRFVALNQSTFPRFRELMHHKRAIDARNVSIPLRYKSVL